MRDDELEALAAASEGAFRRRRRVMEDFRYDEQQEAYWDTTTSTLLGAKSVDGAIHRDDWPTRPNADGEERPYPPSRAINRSRRDDAEGRGLLQLLRAARLAAAQRR